MGRAAILADYQRNYGADVPSAPDPLVSPVNQTPTTTGGLPSLGPVGVASLGSPFAGLGVGTFGTPGYTDAADVYGESSPFGGMGAPAAYDPEAAAYGLGDGGGNEEFRDESYDYGEDI